MDKGWYKIFHDYALRKTNWCHDKFERKKYIREHIASCMKRLKSCPYPVEKREMELLYPWALTNGAWRDNPYIKGAWYLQTGEFWWSMERIAFAYPRLRDYALYLFEKISKKRYVPDSEVDAYLKNRKERWGAWGMAYGAKAHYPDQRQYAWCAVGEFCPLETTTSYLCPRCGGDTCAPPGITMKGRLLQDSYFVDPDVTIGGKFVNFIPMCKDPICRTTHEYMSRNSSEESRKLKILKGRPKKAYREAGTVEMKQVIAMSALLEFEAKVQERKEKL